MDPLVAILAGGRSSRMGAPKPGVALAGRPLIAYPVEAARAAGLDPVVVAKPATELPPLDCRVLLEPAEPAHPLCGIVVALRAARPGPIVALAADMPFVSAALLGLLASASETAAVEADGRPQPLLARYDSADLARLEAALAAEESLTAALRSLEPRLLGAAELRGVGDPSQLCVNVNTRADLARAERQLGSAPATGDEAG